MSQQSTHTPDRIHYSLLQCHYLPVNVRCLQDSLSVTDSGSHSGAPFEAPFVDLCHKFRQLSPATSQRKWHLKILATYHSGAPFQPGALRMCVPCLMVNPALATRCCWQYGSIRFSSSCLPNLRNYPKILTSSSRSSIFVSSDLDPLPSDLKSAPLDTLLQIYVCK